MSGTVKRAYLEKISSIEKIIANIDKSLRDYKIATGHIDNRGNGRGELIESGWTIPPEDTYDVSLFDGLFQEIIQGFNFRIDSSSDSEGSFNIILENTPDAVVLFDLEGVVFQINPSFSNTFGYRESEIIGANILSMIPDTYKTLFTDKLKQFSKSQNISSAPDEIIVIRGRKKDGTVLSVECLVSSFQKDSSVVLAGIMRDVSFNRALFEQLKETKKNYDALSETISEAILRIDENFNIIFANSAVTHTFGYRKEELIGKHFSMLFPAEVFKRNEASFKKYFYVDDLHRKNLGLRKTLELLGLSKHRGVSPMEMSFGNSKDYRGRTLTCIIRDIAHRKSIERKLRHLAFHDQLTNLGNRDLFNMELKALLEELKTYPRKNSALLFLDLDGFKQINDTLGHNAGDEILIETAKRLRKSLRETDSVFRFGGDEFVVLLPSITNKSDVSIVADKMLASIRQPYYLRTEDGKYSLVNLGASIGVALIPDHGEDIENITKNADLAMYNAKDSGKNRFVFYSRGLDKRMTNRWKIEQGIKNALHNHEFDLYYQPIVDGDGSIQGVEALMRWEDPVKGAISPGEFIPIAEETGLIVPLGNWVLETACRDIVHWNKSGYKNLYVSVNLSVRQFEQKNLVELIGDILHRTGADAKNLKLEITESCIMRDPHAAIEKMKRLKKDNPGIQILIDDFGTGYSSLSYLSQLPADSIKIDISFVTKLFQPQNQKIVNAIINLADSLELNYFAEGVESLEQREYFNNRNCFAMQGYHFHKAAERSEISRLLKSGKLA